jgi:hypothetical protein
MIAAAAGRVMDVAGWNRAWRASRDLALTLRRAQGEGQIKVLILSLSKDGWQTTRRAATLLYMGIGLSPLVPFLTSPNASVVDGAGHVWLTHHIRGVSALLGLCTMGLVSVIALRELRRTYH